MTHATCQIFTDGSLRFRAGRGACAFVVVRGEQKIFAGGQVYANTTTNRMELRGVIHGLEWATKHFSEFRPAIFTDSRYVASVPGWIPGWRAKGWITSAGAFVANLDLIYLLWRTMQASPYTPVIQWVRGHNGNRWNEYAHKLAAQYVDSDRLVVPDTDADLALLAEAWAGYPFGEVVG